MKILKLKQPGRENSSNLLNQDQYIKASYTILGLLIITLLTSMVFSAISLDVHANGPTTSQSNVSVNVPNSCTLSGQIVSAHTATIVNGTNRENIGTTKIKIFCNDVGGYTVYAIGASNDKDSNTNLISSIGSHDIATGLSTTGDTSAWAMKLTAGTGTGTDPTLTNIASGYTDYHVIPNTYTAVASRSSSTDMNKDVDVTGSYFTTTYRVFISSTQPAATYTGKVKYAILHPQLNEDPLVSIEQALANAHAPTKTLPSGETYYTIQGLTANICNNANITGSGATAKLIDTRDDNLYYVAKLPDGKCWMLDNLRLDPTDSTTASNMNETNTNATTAVITNYLNGSQTAPQTGWSTVAVADIDTNFESFTEPRINNSLVNTHVTNYGAGSGLTGIYYNYCAATAGTYCYTSGQGVGNATQDVCPANWRMPTGGVDGEYQDLCNILYNDTCPVETSMTATNASSLQYNLSTSFSGRYSGSLAYPGPDGVFYSSTHRDGYYVYSLYVTSSSVRTQDYYYPLFTNRSFGLSMRCVAGD